MSLFNSKQLKKELLQKKVNQIYLFTGPEEGEKDKFIEMIISLVVPEEEKKKDSVGRFYLDNNELLEAVDFALSASMFVDKKICLIRNIHVGSSFKKDRLLWEELLNHLPQKTFLILTTSENKPPASVSKELLKKIQAVQFWTYFDNDLQTYIFQQGQKLNLNFNPKAIPLLIEQTGKDIKKIDAALQLIRNGSLDETVTEKTIKELLPNEKDVSIFDFLENLFQKKENSLGLLKKLLEDQVPELLILNMIMKRAEMLEKYHWKLKEGSSKEEAVKFSGFYQKNHSLFLKQASLFNLKDLNKIFILITQVDYQLKNQSLLKKMTSNPLFWLVSEILFDKQK